MRPLALLALTCAPLGLVADPAPKAGAPRVLAVAAFKDGNWEIYLVYPDTGETKNLTNHKAADTDPVWSPDGERIAFVSNRDSPDLRDQLWIMKADGTDVKKLVPKMPCARPLWSPDGKRIAFQSEKDRVNQIFTADATTGKVTQVTDLAVSVSTREPIAWSPDGKRIAFVSPFGVCTIAADGGKLTDANSYGGDMTWSPDGKQIAFVAGLRGEGGLRRLFTIDADDRDRDRDRNQLTNSDNSRDASNPQWSPDGKQIAFIENGGQIAVIGAGGGKARVITKGVSYGYFRWSPDGKSLSYTQKGKNRLTLVVSTVDGEDPKEVLTDVGHFFLGGVAEWKPK